MEMVDGYPWTKTPMRQGDMLFQEFKQTPVPISFFAKRLIPFGEKTYAPQQLSKQTQLFKTMSALLPEEQRQRQTMNLVSPYERRLL